MVSENQSQLQFEMTVARAAFGPAPGSGPNVLSATDFPKNGELRFPMGVAGFTLFNAFRKDGVNVRLNRLAAATPPRTFAKPV